MTVTGVASANAGKFQRHHFAIKQRDQPAQRTHEALGRLAAPVHALGPIDTGNFFRQQLGKDLRGRSSLFQHCGGEIFALGRGDFLQGVHRYVRLTGEGLGSGRRDSIFIGNFEGRPGELLANVGLGGSDAGSEHGQPPRSGVGLNRGAIGEPLAL